MEQINKPNINIVTVEDPVEYRLNGINQVQVNNKTGLSFAVGLRSILRQDPDVIMIGEIRDLETAEIAIRSAITGHKVLSTIHTNDAVSSVIRLTDMGVENYLVSSALTGVIAQRLIKLICVSCKKERKANLEEKLALGYNEDDDLKIHYGEGCNVCGNTGYSGRRAIHEILVLDDGLRELFLKKESAQTIKKVAVDKGMKTLFDSCKELVLEGVTSFDELYRVAYTVEE